MLTDEQLDKIERRLSNANGLGLDEAVARHYREDVPALLAEVRSLRAQRGAVLAMHQPKPLTVSAMYPIPLCSGRDGEYPCATVRALGVTE